MLVGVRPCARLLGQLQSPPLVYSAPEFTVSELDVCCAARGLGLGCDERLEINVQ